MNKEKIFKILHFIIKIIILGFAVIGAFFSGYLIVASIEGNFNKEEIVLNNNDKPVSKVIDHEATSSSDTNCYIASNTDVVSNTFVSYLYTHYAHNLGTNEYYYDNTFKAYVYTWQNLNLAHPLGLGGIITGYSYYCTSVSVTCTAFARVSQGKQYSSYEVNFNYTNNNNSQESFMRINFDYIYPSVDSLGFENEGILIYDFTTPFYTFFVWRYDDPYVYSSATNYLVNNDYNEGYKLGYENGKEIGYEQGYYAGNNAEHSDMFSLIFGAFDAIASILNIQVLPYLNLGTLLFTPLIVTIIIAVVKMIKA